MLATVASATTKWLIVTMSQKNLFQIERAQWLFYIWIMVLSETVVMPLYKMYVKVHKTGVSNWAQLFFERVRWLFYILKEWYKSFVMPLDKMYEKTGASQSFFPNWARSIFERAQWLFNICRDAPCMEK